MSNMGAIRSDGNKEDAAPIFDSTKSGGYREKEPPLFGEQVEELEPSPDLPRTGELDTRPWWARPRQLLSKEDEASLVAKAKAGDSRARDDLILSHGRLCAKLAKMFRRKLRLEEAVNLAVEGLIDAIENFEPATGWRFNTFARKYVKSAINRAEFDDTTVRRGDLARRALPRIIKEKQRRGVTGAPLSVDTAASIAAAVSDSRIKLTADDVLKADRFGVVSLNVPRSSADDEEYGELVDDLDDGAPNPEEVLIERERRDVIVAGLESLTAIERQVFEARRISDPPKTFRELAVCLDLSPEWIRQIEIAAEAKVLRAAQDALTKRQLKRSARGRSFHRNDDPVINYRRLIDWNFSPKTAQDIIDERLNPKPLVRRVGPMGPIEAAFHGQWKAAHQRLNPKSSKPVTKQSKKSGALSSSVMRAEFSGPGQKASQSSLRSRPSRGGSDDRIPRPEGISRLGTIVTWRAPPLHSGTPFAEAA